MLQLSHLFTADLLGSQFDNQAAEQAANGRVFAPLTQMLDGAYGITIPTGTAAALKALNFLMLTEKAPKLANGPGSRATAVKVWQALHAYAVALHAGMGKTARAALPADFAVTPLPAWADPVAIEAAKAEAKAKADAAKAKATAEAKEATKAAAGKMPEGIEEAPDMSGPAPVVPRDTRAEMFAAWAKFAAYIASGELTASDRDTFILALENCPVKAEPSKSGVTAAQKKAAKAAQAKADKVAKEAMLASFKDAPAVPADEKAVKAVQGKVAGDVSPALAAVQKSIAAQTAAVAA